MRNIANWITASRFPITILMLSFFYQNTKSYFLLTLGLFVLAILSDVADGYVARKLNQVSEVGARLDALLDKIMVYAMIFSLFHLSVYSPVIVFAMFFRDMVADGLRNYVYEIDKASGSNVWGKAKFSFQALSICFGLVYCAEAEYSQLVWYANAFLVCGFVLSLPGLLDIVLMAPSLRGPKPKYVSSTALDLMSSGTPEPSATRSQ